jgi:hypothetical protein
LIWTSRDGNGYGIGAKHGGSAAWWHYAAMTVGKADTDLSERYRHQGIVSRSAIVVTMAHRDGSDSDGVCLGNCELHGFDCNDLSKTIVTIEQSQGRTIFHAVYFGSGIDESFSKSPSVSRQPSHTMTTYPMNVRGHQALRRTLRVVEWDTKSMEHTSD